MIIQSEEGFIKNRYVVLKEFRTAYIDRAEKNSEVTLRYIMPPEGDSSTEEMQRDFSSVGADNVNTLANKYMLTLFPPNKSFFKLQPNITTQTIEHIGITDSEMDTMLTQAEREARWQLEKKHGRPALIDAIKHLIVTGNALIYYPEDGNIQMYALDQYVVHRSMDGTVTEIITEDEKSLGSLDKELREEVMSVMEFESDIDIHKTNVILYTYIHIDEENPLNLIVEQAVEHAPIKEPFTIERNKNRWIPLVWQQTRREQYGRGLVEDHYGSLWAISVLSEAIVTGAAVMSDIKYLVRPGSVLDVVELNKAKSGTYHIGEPDDVQAIGTDKAKDLQFIQSLIEKYERLLGKAFLSMSSQMRDAERVTAEENRMRAQELEQAHGGVFSSLSMELQYPLANLLLDEFNISLTDSGIDLVVVSGLDAMGRVSDNEKLLQLFNDLTLLNNIPESLLPVFKFIDTVKMLANGRDVDVNKIIKSAQEIEQEQQAQAQAQQGQMATEEMMKKASAEQLAEGMQDA